MSNVAEAEEYARVVTAYNCVQTENVPGAEEYACVVTAYNCVRTENETDRSADACDHQSYIPEQVAYTNVFTISTVDFVASRCVGLASIRMNEFSISHLIVSVFI